MSKYVRAAFIRRVRLPGVGRVPFNLLMVCGLALLGLGSPVWWWAGGALELTYLYAMASDPRFREQIELEQAARDHAQRDAELLALVRKLVPRYSQQYQALRRTIDRVFELYDRSETDSPALLASNVRALDELMAVYVKLLGQHQHLALTAHRRNEGHLPSLIRAAECELDRPNLPEPIRQTKRSTLQLYRKRLAVLQQRDRWLDEISSALERIEAQAELALDSAAMSGPTDTIVNDLEVASYLFDDDWLDDNEPTETVSA